MLALRVNTARIQLWQSLLTVLKVHTPPGLKVAVRLAQLEAPARAFPSQLLWFAVLGRSVSVPNLRAPHVLLAIHAHQLRQVIIV